MKKSDPTAGLSMEDDPAFRPIEEFMPEDERNEWRQYLAYLQGKNDSYYGDYTGKPIMKYALTLEDTVDSPEAVNAVTEALAAQGARNIEFHGMNIMTVDSQVPLNFAAIRGVESYQEVKEVGEHKYIVCLTDEAKGESVKDAIFRLGARNVTLHEAIGTLAVDSEIPLNFSGIDGIQSVENEQECFASED